MTNVYFNHSANVVSKGVRALASHVNNVANEIGAGFDKLPTEIQLKEGRTRYAVDTGVADAYVVTLPHVPTLTDGFRATFKAAAANTGASTINYNGLGAKALKYGDGSALPAGAIVVDQILETVYESTSDSFLIMSVGTPTALPVVGIRSTATGERLLVSDGIISVGAAGINYEVSHAADDQILIINGGLSGGSSGNVQLYGGAHSSAGDWILRSGANRWMQWDESVGDLEILTGVGVKTSALTISPAQLATFAGDVTVQGAFTSLGIDDNATGERLQIGDNIIQLGTPGTGYVIGSIASDQALSITGSTNTGVGGKLVLYGENHATKPGDVLLTSGVNEWMRWDESVGDLEILTGVGVKTSALTISPAQLATFAGDVTVQGAFTSLGIDDNATGERVQIGDTIIQVGTAGASYSIGRNVSDRSILIAGGINGADGANMQCMGSTHTSAAGDMFLRNGINSFLAWDESVGDLEILTGVGVKTSALTIDASQNATFAGDVTANKILYTKKGADVASANDLVLLADGNYNDVTGTTDVNGMTDGVLNEVRKLHFDGAVLLKHNTAASAGYSSLWLPNAADYTTVANDELEFVYDGIYWRLSGSNSHIFYEEGSFTPILWDNSAADEGQTYGAQNGGFYTRIGRQVYCHGTLHVAGLGTLTVGNNAAIGGLPFTAMSNNSEEAGGGIVSHASAIALSAQSAITILVADSDQYAGNAVNFFYFRRTTTSGTTPVLISEITASGIVRFQLWYQV